MAEDGHVYERTAIGQWLQRSGKSPVTNLEMGQKLLDAKQVRSMLATMVKSGAISGDKADKWQERLKAEDQAREWQREAEGGDARAMCKLGASHDRANDDSEAVGKARMWYQRSAQHGYNRGLTNYANKLHNSGEKGHAALHWMEAATRGDAWACIQVAGLYSRGISGYLAQDLELAKRWCLKALACKLKDDGDGALPDEDDEAKANAWLDANADVAALWFDAPDRHAAGRERDDR